MNHLVQYTDVVRNCQQGDIAEVLMEAEVGVLFDIDEQEGYGGAAWTIVMKVLDPTKLAFCILFSGDTLIPASREPYSPGLLLASSVIATLCFEAPPTFASAILQRTS